MSDTVLALFSTLVEPTSRDEYVEQSTRITSALAGTLVPFDHEEARAGAELQYDRATDLAAAGNHNRAQARSRDRAAVLGQVTVPTLIIHGTEDSIIPFAHGEATAKAIPHARFVPIEGLGHEMPTGIQDRIADLVLEHTAAP